MALIVSLADVKARLRITDATDDAYLTSLITSCGDWMEAYAGRYLTDHPAETHIYDTAYGSSIEVPEGIRTITALQVAQASQPDGAWAVYPTALHAQYLTIRRPDGGQPGLPGTRIVILTPGVACVDAINAAKLVGDYGPATTPSRFSMIAQDAVASAYQSRRIGATGAIGPDDVSYPWQTYFAHGSPQRMALRELRGVAVG